MEYVLLVLGFVLLIKGADLFVDGASSIAKKLRIPSIIIGLTVVAFGTSAPEAAVSVSAAINGNNGIAVGNIVGSNLFNLLIVIGICAFIAPVKVDKTILLRDYPLSIIASLALLFMCFDTVLSGQDKMVLSNGDGLVLLIFFSIFLYATIKGALEARSEAKVNDEEESDTKAKSVPVSLFLLLLGITGIVGGGELTVRSASTIAGNLGMSDTLIGLTIIAIGTSLPELVTSLVAIKKRENDLALGNVVGSNIFNIFFILGLSASIHSIDIVMNNIVDIIMLLIINSIVYLFIIRSKQVKRSLGIFMIVSYIGYMVYAVIR